MFALSLIVLVFITVRIVPPDYPNHPTFKDLLSVCGARQNCIFRPALQDSGRFAVFVKGCLRNSSVSFIIMDDFLGLAECTVQARVFIDNAQRR